MKTVYLLFVAFCLSFVCHAQTMVLQVDRSHDSIVSKKGPNMKRFIQGFMGGGFVAGGDEQGARIKYGASGEVFFGVRFKYKISKVYSLGWELQVGYQYFKLKQNSEKTLPDTLQHDVERFDVYNLGLSFYNRFNFDPNRGNYLGKYLDLGITGNWYNHFAHLTKDKLPDGSKIRVQQTNLPYQNGYFGADAFARIGLSHLSLYARYRLTDFFKPSYNYPELPRVMVGLEIGIF